MPNLPEEDTAPARDYRGYGKLMPVSLRARLAVAVARHGLRPVARTIGIAPQTILRALAGPAAGVRHGTILAVEVGVAKIERETPQAAATPEGAPLPPPPPDSNGGAP